ncbi:hypothetical protein Plim_2660 [Planctopirus limnophila DSM 3776]|uniref:Uncharacterized protein n=1 Tax=Planctopirus limnophila (strain ATCC 43296 / DSM 3776 / IFAM 1008 / Mu 290) TaxID=521674 RepID=D5SQM1_PLAL2|nr:hypothetical protein Plim_2660 [Planctopirus limnophila DSM 3776]
MLLRKTLGKPSFETGVAEGVTGLGVSTVRVVIGGAFGNGVGDRLGEKGLSMGLAGSGWGREL